MQPSLGAGEARRVDNGHLVEWSDSCSISATAGSGSIVGSMTSGEGMMLLVRGPGRVWVQSHKASAHGSQGNHERGGRRRGGGGGGGGVQIDGVLGSVIGGLFGLVFFLLFFGAFAYIGGAVCTS